MNLWLNKSCVCWSWNTGQETPDVLNSIIYVAINKNTSITGIPELANNIVTHTSTLGKYQHNQLSCTSPPAMQSALPGGKYSLWLGASLWIGDWCPEESKGITGNDYTWLCPLSFCCCCYHHRFCLPKLYQWGLVRSISKTRYRLWLQCQWHNKWGESESECLCHRYAALGSWRGSILSRDQMMLWFIWGGVTVAGIFQRKCFLQMTGMGCSG